MIVTSCLFALNALYTQQWIKAQGYSKGPGLLFPIEVQGRKILATIECFESNSYLPRAFMNELTAAKSSAFDTKLPGIPGQKLDFIEWEQLDNVAIIGGRALKKIRLFWDVSRGRVIFDTPLQNDVEGVPFINNKFRYGNQMYRLPVMAPWAILPNDSPVKSIARYSELIATSRFDFLDFSDDSYGLFPAHRTSLTTEPTAAGSTFGNQTIIIDFEYKKIRFEVSSRHRLAFCLSALSGVIFEYSDKRLMIVGHNKESENQKIVQAGLVNCEVESLGGISLSGRTVSDSELVKNFIENPICIILKDSKRIKLEMTINK